MARETKVGLLAGLAFIVCFAVILANRGRQQPPATHLSYNVDQGDNLPLGGGDRPSRAGNREQRSGQGQAATPTNGPASGRRRDQQARRTTPPAGTNGANVVLPSSRPASGSVATGPIQTPPQRIPEATRSDAHTTSLAAVTAPAGDPALTYPTAEQRERQRALLEHLDALGTGTGRQESSGRPGSSTGPRVSRTRDNRPAATPSPRYTTKPGDTLTRIAAAHYGRRTPAVINAVFKANRTVLSDPDVLPVNVELVLPPISGIVRSTPPNDGPGAARRTRPAARSAGDRTNTGTGSFRWYQIRKNDRYISIARERLGDSNRWREIYELNKDKFPDPQRIREGVRIKLPSASTAIAEGRQR